MTTSPPAALSGDALVEMLGVMKRADSVELKLTVADKGQRSAVIALGLDPLLAQIRLVHFFDTPDLALEKAGVVVRARRTQGRDDDTVVKLRPIDPDAVPDELRASPRFGIEVDVTRSGYVCSGSLKGIARTPVASLRDGTPLRKVFTKEQRALYEQHAPEGIALDDLVTLGPIFVLKLKGTPAGYDGKLVGEMWLYPDGTRILELSTKCAPGEAFQVAAEARAFLAERGIQAAVGQETKTRKALTFFSKELQAAR
jgi:hypothetical protein